MSIEAHEKLTKDLHTTTFRNLSEYLRAILQKDPVIIRYRNQSADDFLAYAIELKKELQTTTSAFKACIRELQASPTTPYPAKLIEFLLTEEWDLTNKINNLAFQMDKIYKVWSSPSAPPPDTARA